MKKLDIICILDMSGSMDHLIVKAREGFNKYLNDQKTSGNDINFSLMFFDTDFYMPYNNVNINEVKEVDENTYYAKGGTSLYDAVGSCIDNYLDFLGNTPKEDRSDKSLFVILTDGEENSSQVYHRELIKFMVTDMREQYNSEFIYLGANQDACFQAEVMGMNRSNASNYDATNDGITVAFSKASTATSYYTNTNEKENLFQQQ